MPICLTDILKCCCYHAVVAEDVVEAVDGIILNMFILTVSIFLDLSFYLVFTIRYIHPDIKTMIHKVTIPEFFSAQFVPVFLFHCSKFFQLCLKFKVLPKIRLYMPKINNRLPKIDNRLPKHNFASFDGNDHEDYQSRKYFLCTAFLFAVFVD